MSRVAARIRSARLQTHVEEIARAIIVAGCGLSLVMAGAAFPL
ncbi:hypothetical protein [Qipengyuania sp. MTN3-11]